ncbi:hypothetical protein LOK49_LG14G00876 [Camellia lanceoleosa]|uniref:Uncharacterized protein n=1 Tax=Camellia lanceoleosa TaxID=1840588 RepID=A0ACC0F9Z0_9ERIC|nr:hypothetical protein LOK49_LG14G00876 [Camellia lanceoleosa]
MAPEMRSCSINQDDDEDGVLKIPLIKSADKRFYQSIGNDLYIYLVYEAPHPSALAKLDPNLRRAGHCERYGILTTCQLQHDPFLDE